jgi:pimeloyl-ACP methyl ester carboxylesterase
MSAERIIPVNGIQLCVQTFGDPGDPAVLLIGGMSSPMDWWEDGFCDRLSAGRRYVVRYDFRDTGRSTTYLPGQPAYTGADLRNDAVALLDALGIGQAHLAGVSMGGAIAQCLAVEQPGRVQTLTLIDTTAALPGAPEGLPEMERVLAAYLQAAGERPEPDWTDREAVIERLAEDQRAFMRGGFDQNRVRAIIGQVVDRSTDIAAMGNHARLDPGPGPGGTLADIAAPALVIHGTADPLFPLPHGEALAAAIPDAALLPLEGVGHELPPPADWDQVVTAMLRHTSGDYEPAELPILAAAEARGDSTGWFEELYAAGVAGAAPMPWSRTEPHPLLVEWAEAEELHGPGRAVVVGCALGADAEFVSGRGFDTTGFDISQTAIRSARERHQGSGVEYVVASVLDLPDSWHKAFDLVVEIITVQALPDDVRPRAIAGVMSLVATGGTLFVIALRDDGTHTAPPPPTPLTRTEIDSFARHGLIPHDVAEVQPPGGPRWRAVFQHRP